MFGDSMIGFSKDGLVCCRFWEHECVIYRQLNGETHLIDGLGAEIFKLISEKRTTRTQLIQNILSVFELEIDFDVEDFLDNLILQYQKLGLLDVIKNSPG
jgi:PqqD family protein of HPr-rel-A system